MAKKKKKRKNKHKKAWLESVRHYSVAKHRTPEQQADVEAELLDEIMERSDPESVLDGFLKSRRKGNLGFKLGLFKDRVELTYVIPITSVNKGEHSERILEWLATSPNGQASVSTWTNEMCYFLTLERQDSKTIEDVRKVLEANFPSTDFSEGATGIFSPDGSSLMKIKSSKVKDKA